MNVSLLKLARRHSNGCRYWTVPGYGNAAKLVPARHTMGSWGSAAHWPARDERGEKLCGVDLNRHRKMARAEIRKLISTL